MTTQTQYAVDTDRRGPSWPLFAVLGTGIALVLTAVGTFWDVTGNEPGAEDHSLVGEYLTVIAIIAVTTAVLYAFVVRSAPTGNAGRRSLVLAVLGVLSIVVFWAGLPTVFALAAGACALSART